MATLFPQLTLRHFIRGWSIFWRINLPFWITLLHVIGAYALAGAVVLSGRWNGVEGWVPSLGAQPLFASLLSGTLFFLGLWPLVWPTRRALSRSADSAFWTAQFAMVAKLNRFARSLAVLLALLAMVVLGRSGLVTGREWLVALMAFLLLSVLALFVGLVGRVAEEWRELEVS